MSQAKRHTHKYYRAEVAWGRVWACALPDCHHYMPQHMESLMNGKSSICWECGEKFVMTPASMEMDKPVCASCLLGEEVAQKIASL